MTCVLAFSACASLIGQTKTAPATKESALVAQARKQLELAAMEASAASPATQATIFLGVARAYSRTDKARSADYLQRAYDLALRLTESDSPGIGAVQHDAITEMAQLDPQQVEQNMPAEPALREAATSQLVRYYSGQRSYDHAIELLQTLKDPDWVAQEMMMALGAQHSDERNQVIAIVLESYRRRGFVNPGRGTDLGTLLVRFWRDLRPQLVNEAADELLKEADPANADQNREVRVGVTASSANGSVSFANFYEFRLFQLLPILKATDPTRAEALLRENAQRGATLAKYPNGQNSFDPTLRDTPLKDGETSDARYTIVRDRDTAVRATQMGSDPATAEVTKLAAEQPQQALARVKALTQGRTAAAMALARETVSTAPDVAQAALRIALEAKRAPFVPAAKLYLQMNDAAGARVALERGMTAAEETYKEDADPEDPNQAIRLLWPSTQQWRDVIDVAAEISPEFAIGLVNEIPDREIKPLERTFLAGRWLGVAPWSSTSPFVMHRGRK